MASISQSGLCHGSRAIEVVMFIGVSIFFSLMDGADFVLWRAIETIQLEPMT